LTSVSKCPRDIKKTTLRDSLLQPDCQNIRPHTCCAVFLYL
jgi:hypothetical protein